MPSHKRDSITAEAMGLIFALFITSSWDVLFSLTAMAKTLASWFYQNLPLFSFVLNSFLHWRFAVRMLWLRCKTWAVLAGALLMLFLTWNFPQSVQRAGSKTKHCYTLWSSGTPTFKLITEVNTLTIRHSVFSIIAGLIVEMFFTGVGDHPCFFAFFITMIPIDCKIIYTCW